MNSPWVHAEEWDCQGFYEGVTNFKLIQLKDVEGNYQDLNLEFLNTTTSHK